MSDREQAMPAARPGDEGREPCPRYEADPDEIDLREYLATLWRHRRMILAIVAAAVLVAACVSLLAAPTYELHTTLALAQYPSGFYTNPAAVKDGTHAVPLVRGTNFYANPVTAQEVLRSTDFIAEAAAAAGVPADRRSLAALAENLEIKAIQDANLLKITFKTQDVAAGRALLEKMAALYAAKSAQELAVQQDLLRRQLAEVEKRQAEVERGIDEVRRDLAGSAAVGGLEAVFQRAQLLSALQGLEEQRLSLLDRYFGLQKELASLRPVQVVQKAEEPLRPVQPRPALNLAMALVLGLMVAVLAAFAREYFRRPVSAGNVET